jgi:hypothetical protein
MVVIDLDADYVVYGSGAMGMAFVDVLMTETQAKIVLVDRHGQPGGHWNDAYPYVKLHQSSAFYGVNSQRLERDPGDYLALASRNEILAYYERLITSWTASGRVVYYPLCVGEDPSQSRRFHCSLNPSKAYEVVATAKVVNATYMDVRVPSMSHATERYKVADGAEVVPLNDLTNAAASYKRYILIGAGKTAYDAALWLLSNGVEPESISWIMPRDALLLNRDFVSPDAVFPKLFDLASVAKDAKTPKDFMAGMTSAAMYHMIDPSRTPTMWKCATVSSAELEQLRKLKTGILRMGHVLEVERDRIALEGGSLAIGPPGSTLCVDCSTDGLSTRPSIPVFKGDVITLQSVRLCQQVFSAALIAHLEARGGNEETKNKLSIPVPHPDNMNEREIMNEMLKSGANSERAWCRDPELSKWLRRSRLNFDAHRPHLRTVTKALLENWHRLPTLIQVLRQSRRQTPTAKL